MTASRGSRAPGIRNVPFAERPAHRRARILEAAIEIYGEKGFRNATVRAICHRAGLTERYFYESFVSSDDLLIETAHTLAERTFELLHRVVEKTDGDPDKRTSAMFRAYFRQQYEQRRYARLFTLEFRGLSPSADAAFAEILETFADMIVALRTARPVSRLLRYGLIGAILHLATGWIEADFHQPLDEVVNAATQFCRIIDT